MEALDRFSLDLVNVQTRPTFSTGFCRVFSTLEPQNDDFGTLISVLARFSMRGSFGVWNRSKCTRIDAYRSGSGKDTIMSSFGITSMKIRISTALSRCVLHPYEVGTQTDNSKVDLGLKIDDFRISTRHIRKPHGGIDGYRSFGNLKIWIFCDKN